MPDLQWIARLSNLLFWLATGLTYAVVLMMAALVLLGLFFPQSLRDLYPDMPGPGTVTPVQAALVAGLSILALVPMVAAFHAMASLFNRYRQGDILSDASADDIPRIGRAMVFVALATVVMPTLQVLVLTWFAEETMLRIGVDGGAVGFLLSAGLLTAIGWAMREAARLKTENEAFV